MATSMHGNAKPTVTSKKASCPDSCLISLGNMKQKARFIRTTKLDVFYGVRGKWDPQNLINQTHYCWVKQTEEATFA